MAIFGSEGSLLAWGCFFFLWPEKDGTMEHLFELFFFLKMKPEIVMGTFLRIPPPPPLIIANSRSYRREYYWDVNVHGT